MAYKILIIDDDTELLKMLKKYLEIKKYEIITAENGLEGINKIKLQPAVGRPNRRLLCAMLGAQGRQYVMSYLIYVILGLE